LSGPEDSKLVDGSEGKFSNQHFTMLAKNLDLKPLRLTCPNIKRQMKTKKVIFLLILSLIMTGCAASFKVVNPAVLSYANTQKCNDKLEVSYLDDFYSLTRNYKYFYREKEYNYRTIAIRLKNLTDSSRQITNDNFRIYVNNVELPNADKTKYFKRVHQEAGLFLLHLSWGLVLDYLSAGISGGPHPTRSEFDPKCSLVAVTIGICNMLYAGNANDLHKTFINENEIFGRTVKPGETIYGIVVLNNSHYEPLVFKYLDK
jgi:hypothetical protein